MPDLDILRIAERRKTIESNVQELAALRGRTFEAFVADTRTLAATKYWLQIATQAMIDITSHICARLRIVTQPDSGECVRALQAKGYFSKERATQYVKMIRLRNVLVHLYSEVDNHTVHDLVENQLDAFRMFLMDVDAIVEKQQRETKPGRARKD